MLKQLFYELSRGFAYRAISHKEMSVYTLWLPLLIAVFILISYVLLPISPKLVGAGGLFANLLTIVSTLPGFYFAGLAAVSTFGSASMDKEMPAPAPEIDILVGDRYVKVKLTRRLFLSYLFSYLVILSFALCLALLTINSLEASIGIFKSALAGWSGAEWPWWTIKCSVGFLVAFGFSSIVVSTLHGIFFLSEKIHQPS